MNKYVSEPASAMAGQGVDLIDLLAYVWHRRRAVVVVMLLFLLLGSVYLHGARYRYTAELKVSPVQSSAIGGSKLGGLSSLASIAGLSLPRDPATMSFMLYMESVHSSEVATALARRPDLMRVAFEDEWDQRRSAFVEPTGMLHGVVRQAKQILGVPIYQWSPPDARRMQDFLARNVNVVQNAKSPVVVLTLEHEDSRFAAEFLKALHAAADANLRRKALAHSTQYIGYLTQQLTRVTLTEHRAALASALSEQVKEQMMASSNLAYAAETFGQPLVSTQPTSPRPIVVLASSLVLGLLVGGGLVLFSRRLADRRRGLDGIGSARTLGTVLDADEC